MPRRCVKGCAKALFAIQASANFWAKCDFRQYEKIRSHFCGYLVINTYIVKTCPISIVPSKFATEGCCFIFTPRALKLKMGGTNKSNPLVFRYAKMRSSIKRAKKGSSSWWKKLYRLHIYKNECDVDVESMHMVFDEKDEPAQESQVRTQDTKSFSFECVCM